MMNAPPHQRSYNNEQGTAVALFGLRLGPGCDIGSILRVSGIGIATIVAAYGLRQVPRQTRRPIHPKA